MGQVPRPTAPSEMARRYSCGKCSGLDLLGRGRRNAQAYSFEGCGRAATDKWRICCFSQQRSITPEHDRRAARVAIPRLHAMAGKAARHWTIAFGGWLPFYQK